MELKDRAMNDDKNDKFAVLNRRLIQMDRKFGLQERQNKENKVILTSILTKLKTLEEKVEFRDRAINNRVDSIVQNVRLRHESPTVSVGNNCNLQKFNAAYENEPQREVASSSSKDRGKKNFYFLTRRESHRRINSIMSNHHHIFRF